MNDVLSITPANYRTVWISDVHLGFRGCQAKRLLRFLNKIQCETLYLTGDIIDLWAMRRKLYWPESHNEVLYTILRKAQTGTNVVYIPGNHDDLLRRYDNNTFAHVKIRKRALHITADGKRLSVIHGDEFDAAVRHSRSLAILGDASYDLLIILNTTINAFRRKLGFGYWSLAAFLKRRVKKAVDYINRFENAAIEEVRKNLLDGIICGHIHKGNITQNSDIIYGNCGDWVESCTALVEHHDGRLELLDLKHLNQADLAPGREAA